MKKYSFYFSLFSGIIFIFLCYIKFFISDGSTKTIRVYSKSSGTITNLQFSSKGDKIAIAAKNIQINMVLDSAKLGYMRYVRIKSIFALPPLTFTPDDSAIIFIRDDFVCILDSSTGKVPALPDPFEEHSIGGKDPIQSMACNPNGKILACGGEKKIYFWDIPTRKIIGVLNGHLAKVNSLVFSPDGKMIASGSSDKTIKLWNVESRTEIITLTGHNDSVNSLSLSPDGNILLSSSDDKTIKIWDMLDKTVINTLHGHTSTVSCIQFSPNGKTFASCSSDGVIKFWDALSYNELSTYKVESDPTSVIAYSPDNKYLVSGHREMILKFWRVPNPK